MPNRSSLFESICIAAYFARDRWGCRFKSRGHLEKLQKIRLDKFIKNILPRAEYYQGMGASSINDLPYMDKESLMKNFNTRNTRGIKLDQALAVALHAEESRDFSSTIDDITVGLSSGTSGKQGVFLVSKAERYRWAGILLARTLPSHLLRHILKLWSRPLKIAFFLRANSNLYNTLSSSRIDFGFYDLLNGIDNAIPRLEATKPDVLVAPATTLRILAEAILANKLSIRPKHVISVAEVLEPAVADLIENAFGIRPDQIYQATEGFLGYTCEFGTMHLNETHIYIEPEWLDTERTRFQPIITDFSRDTQLIVRYRLNDILRVLDIPCPCGRFEISIAAVEGRSDEILWLPSHANSEAVAIFPDVLRRAMMLVKPMLSEYTIYQDGNCWKINFLTDDDRVLVIQAVKEAIESVCKKFNVIQPSLVFGMWQPQPLGTKRRRLYCEKRPQDTLCMS